jgi:N-formylglutamate deformylase
MRAAFTFVEGPGPVVATALHGGHDLRPAIARRIRVADDARRREEDPGTDRLTTIVDTQVVVHRSRFEVDLNRPRERAVYREPDAAWGLDLWEGAAPTDDLIAESLEVWDDFYARVAALLDIVAEQGRFVVLDLHSYNHRRDGAAAAPSPVADNPEVNVGTGSLDRAQWAPVVERFMDDLRTQVVAGEHLDVRENVRFTGGHLARWVDERYAGRGCAHAIELKKTYMDEWTGEIDDGHLAELRAALGATVAGLIDVLAAVRS